MGPIPLRPLNHISSTTQGKGGTAIELRANIKIRTDGDDPEEPILNSPLLAVVLIVFALFYLTLFSMVGWKVMDVGRRRRRSQEIMQRTDPEISRTGDNYFLLASMLGLDVEYTREGISQLRLLDDKPMLWDIPANQLETERPFYWGDIIPISVMPMLSEEKRCCIKDAVYLALQPTPLHPTDGCICCHHCHSTVARLGARGQDEEHRAPLPHKDIQVVVAILMPRHPGQRGARDRTVDYSIGVHEAPWNDD